jgi:hypothetical protein
MSGRLGSLEPRYERQKSEGVCVPLRLGRLVLEQPDKARLTGHAAFHVLPFSSPASTLFAGPRNLQPLTANVKRLRPDAA